MIFRILPVRYAFQESTTWCATAAGITDERGWTKFSLCKKIHRKIFSKNKFSIEKKIQKTIFQQKVEKLKIWDFDFLYAKNRNIKIFNFSIKKSKSQNFQLFNFFLKIIFFRIFCSAEKYFFENIFRWNFLQNENIIQPHSSVMPAAVVYRVVAAIYCSKNPEIPWKSRISMKSLQKVRYWRTPILDNPEPHCS